MVMLVGHSGSGKSTVEKLMEGYGLKRIVSCTTRPPRPYEVQGTDYLFLSDGVFNALDNFEMFAERTTYREWQYGTLAESIKPNSVLVIEPKGMQQIIDKLGRENVIIVFVQTDEVIRKRRLLERGDDLAEIDRRITSDRELFAGVDKKADYILHNNLSTMGGLDLAVNIFMERELLPEMRNKGWF